MLCLDSVFTSEGLPRKDPLWKCLNAQVARVQVKAVITMKLPVFNTHTGGQEA